MNHVFTALFTGVPDPQRGRYWRTDLKAFHPLMESIDEPLMVCVNETYPWAPPKIITVIYPEQTHNPYWQRWYAYRDQLRRLDKDDLVWCVDGTDVLMLNSPWDQMDPNKLYIGSEPLPVNARWMTDNHQSCRSFPDFPVDRPLLNPGLVGGSVKQVLNFVDCFLWSAEVYKFVDEHTDMGWFDRYIRHAEWDHVTGHPVHTPYRSFRTSDPEAWWAHK